ncbi:MAG: cytochrome c oxidase accessory protein CcoG [Gammaproteobacteria bacterium]|nr:cytochrome c oxidase accessory protein CcoG [Gammaproteobacteria bacterium]
MAMPEVLFQERIEIFPRSVKGRYRSIKTGILLLAYSVYFLLPWLRWSREVGPDQAILFDIDGRRFYIFDLVVYAQDIFWLAGLLIIGAFLLFFVTGLAGRVFCGYFCFQTLWTDVFVLIEHLVQGERNARIKLAQADWSKEKIIKMGLTHFLWLLVAFLTGLSFTLYWGNAPELFIQIFTGDAPFAAYATTLFLAMTTYVMAGMAREQVCTYMCPYARFQAVMFDSDTLIVAYDESRGEREKGRLKPKKGLMTSAERDNAEVGDCIDCGYCVQVCPTGIDIRNGMQYQCTSCALCIDACNTIMTSIKFPQGLIKYSSEHALEGKKTQLFKAKNIGYAIAILATIVLLVWSIATRSDIEMLVRQVRQPLSVTLSDGRVQNRYDIKINNKTTKPAKYLISIEGLNGAELDMGRFSEIHLAAEHSVKLIAKVRIAPEKVSKSRTEFNFVINSVDSKIKRKVSQQNVFYVPERLLKKK